MMRLLNHGNPLILKIMVQDKGTSYSRLFRFQVCGRAQKASSRPL